MYSFIALSVVLATVQGIVRILLRTVPYMLKPRYNFAASVEAVKPGIARSTLIARQATVPTLPGSSGWGSVSVPHVSSRLSLNSRYPVRERLPNVGE